MFDIMFKVLPKLRTTKDIAFCPLPIFHKVSKRFLFSNILSRIFDKHVGKLFSVQVRDHLAICTLK